MRCHPYLVTPSRLLHVKSITVKNPGSIAIENTPRSLIIINAFNSGAFDSKHWNMRQLGRKRTGSELEVSKSSSSGRDFSPTKVQRL